VRERGWATQRRRGVQRRALTLSPFWSHETITIGWHFIIAAKLDLVVKRSEAGCKKKIVPLLGLLGFIARDHFAGSGFVLGIAARGHSCEREAALTTDSFVGNRGRLVALLL
jgi:hypothetical protein